ncbi:MAG: hypothetical protein J7L39_00935 [Candidatus Aenigmarchaeota archaeon]|nr:hypothetical protein [Candidatus Aenigmarchaeota archaeon]
MDPSTVAGIKILEDLEKEIENTQVVAPVGGSGSRMIPPQIVDYIVEKYGKRGLEKLYTPKPLLKLKGRPLLEYFIELFKGCGFEEFVFLIGRGGEKIKELVGDGRLYGINVRYSKDPKVPKVGKGKAIKNAILNGKIDINKRSIVGFPDDIILYLFAPLELLARHLYYREHKNIAATILLSPSFKSPYGVVDIENFYVKKFVEKPSINLYVNTGIVVLEPEVYTYATKLIDINSSTSIEIEDAVYPALAKEGKVAYHVLPPNSWFPVNTYKDLKKLEGLL